MFLVYIQKRKGLPSEYRGIVKKRRESGHGILTEKEEGCGSECEGDVDTSENTTSSCPGLIQAFLGGGKKKKKRKENHSDLKCWDLTATTASLVLCPQRVTRRGGEGSLCHLTGALLSLEPTSQVTTGGDNRPGSQTKRLQSLAMLPQFLVEVGVVITPNSTWIRKRSESKFFIIIISTYLFFTLMP